MCVELTQKQNYMRYYHINPHYNCRIMDTIHVYNSKNCISLFLCSLYIQISMYDSNFFIVMVQCKKIIQGKFMYFDFTKDSTPDNDSKSSKYKDSHPTTPHMTFAFHHLALNRIKLLISSILNDFSTYKKYHTSLKVKY